MSIVLKPFSDGAEGGPLGYSFWCPGCNEAHSVWVRRIPGGIQGDAWGWNGSLERPTFTPSVLVRQGHYAYDEPRDKCWCTWNRDHPEQPSAFTCKRCHSFVTDGEIDFLGDCSHALRGKHPLPPHPRVDQGSDV